MLARIMTVNASDLRHCSIAATLSLIGEKWTILILRDVFHGVTRFDDFLRRLECSPAVLSARLKTLTDAGLLRKVATASPASANASNIAPPASPWSCCRCWSA